MELEYLINVLKRVDFIDKSRYYQRGAGAYNTSLSGNGLSFDNIRKYEIGDDIRNINWNVTARFHEPYVNTFTQDKHRLIWLVIDVSGSSLTGRDCKSKIDLEIETAAILAYNAIKKNDSVGVIFFNDKVERVIPQSNGMQHFWLIAKTMIDMNPRSLTTNIAYALEFLMSISSKRSLIFILSDFISNDDYGTSLNIARQKHKVMAIKVHYEGEYKFPSVGWIKLKDAESKEQRWLNTNATKFKKNYSAQFEEANNHFENNFKDFRLNTMELATHEDIAEKLMSFIIF